MALLLVHNALEVVKFAPELFVLNPNAQLNKGQLSAVEHRQPIGHVHVRVKLKTVFVQQRKNIPQTLVQEL